MMMTLVVAIAFLSNADKTKFEFVHLNEFSVIRGQIDMLFAVVAINFSKYFGSEI